MKLKDKTDEPLKLHTRAFQPHAEDTSANHSPSHEEIQLRAYEIYLERGGLPGNELGDWLQAERELECTAPPKATVFSVKGEAQ